MIGTYSVEYDITKLSGIKSIFTCLFLDKKFQQYFSSLIEKLT